MARSILGREPSSLKKQHEDMTTIDAIQSDDVVTHSGDVVRHSCRHTFR